MKKAFALFLLLMLSLPIFSKPTFALVLSGGGARGIAHIPILQELDRRGIKPDYVIGTSMGALVGAFYAAGYSGDEIRTLVENTDLPILFQKFNVRGTESRLRGSGEDFLNNIAVIRFSDDNIGSTNGLIDDALVASFIRENLASVLSVTDFDELSIPYRAVGTDIGNGRKVVFSQGDFFDAIRASISIPIAFIPVELEDGRYIVDGGLVDNIPVSVAKELDSDLILSVDVNNTLESNNVNKENIGTLTGLLSVFLDMITLEGIEESYRETDYILIPDVREFGVLDFASSGKILEKGDVCVEENKEVFDELEEILGTSDEKVVRYSEIEPLIITSISYPGLEEYYKEFDKFLSKPFDKENAKALEELLRYIKDKENLLSITYSLSKDGRIDLEVEEYEKLPSSLSVGLSLDARGTYQVKNNDFSFSFVPVFDLLLDLGLGESGNVAIGLDIDSYSDLLVGYYHTFLDDDSLMLFLEGRVGVGSLSMLSKPRRIDKIDTTDFGSSFSSGLSYDIANEFNVGLTFDLDIAVLGEIRSVDTSIPDRPREFVIHPLSSLFVEYKNYVGRGADTTGFGFNFDFSIALEGELFYKGEFSFESNFQTEVPFMNVLFDMDLFASRYDPLLGSSYMVTEGGFMTRDYVSAILGLRFFLPANLYFDVAFVAEGYENPQKHHQRLWAKSNNLIPFALISDYSLGGKVALGYPTDFGDVSIYFFFDHHGSLSFGVSFI